MPQLRFVQDKERALEEATQAALEASSAAEAQHAAMSKQLAADKRNVQEQMDQVSTCSTDSKCNLRAPTGAPPVHLALRLFSN